MLENITNPICKTLNNPYTYFVVEVGKLICGRLTVQYTSVRNLGRNGSFVVVFGRDILIVTVR